MGNLKTKPITPKENFFIGMSLSNSSNYDSSICVIDRNSHILYLDKFFLAQDIDFFFMNTPYLNKSAVSISVPYDNKLLEGKWRIHSKNYKPLFDYFKVNRDNWTNRISKRCFETIKKIKDKNIKIIRCDINQLRSAYGLSAYCPSRTSADCKDLQTSLKIKYGFSQMPESMLSASSLEAIICAMFIKEYTEGIETKPMFEIDSIPVLARKFN